LLRDGGPAGAGSPTLGLATGLGWFITKHALGLYGTGPPPGGFRRGDTSADQAAIDASAADVALELESPADPAATSATVLAATVIRDHTGAATGAPVIARMLDGRHVAAAPADADVLSALSDADVPGMVGTQIAVEGSPPRYRQAGA
jgi:acetyl-CoA C-acetyltransferase